MYKFQVYEKRRSYALPTPASTNVTESEVVEDWFLTHEVSVPDKETLGMIMHATANQLALKAQNIHYRSE